MAPVSLSLIMTNGTTTDALFIQPRTLTPRERMINHPRCVTALPIKEDRNLALGTNDISLTMRKFIISDTTGLSKRNGAKLRESFCPAAASHSRPRQAVA